MTYEILIDGQAYSLELEHQVSNGSWLARVRESGSAAAREVRFTAVASGEGVLSLLLDGRSYELKRDAGGLLLNGRRYHTELRDPRSLRSRRSAGSGQDGPRKLLAPMPGKIVRLLAAEGAKVEAGDGIVVVEAMKMQNEMRSPRQGVLRVLVAEGAAVNAGDVLAIVE